MRPVYSVAPVMHVVRSRDNPSIIQVGGAYNDLDATRPASRPQPWQHDLGQVAEYGWVASPVKAGLRPPPSAANAQGAVYLWK
jgi:hypothetical protein